MLFSVVSIMLISNVSRPIVISSFAKAQNPLDNSAVNPNPFLIKIESSYDQFNI